MAETYPANYLSHKRPRIIALAILGISLSLADTQIWDFSPVAFGGEIILSDGPSSVSSKIFWH